MPYKNLIELDQLREHFHEPMADVARKFGVCTTFFKRICRTYGIKRWPFRKLQSIQKKIEESSKAESDQLTQLHIAREHLQTTGIPPPNMNNISKPRADNISKPRAVSVTQKLRPIDPMAGLLALKHASNPAIQAPVEYYPEYPPSCFPLLSAPMTIRNGVGGLTLVLNNADLSENPRGSEQSNEQDESTGSSEEVEEASRILGGLVRENLFKHSLHECSQNPEEHCECLNRFDSIQGGAVYIFEIGVTGEPRFTYISRGSMDVYGLTPQQVTDQDGCQKILSVIHKDDQASFIQTVQDSRLNLTEWIWRGRTSPPNGEGGLKGIYARSIPTKLPDGSVRWEGFLLECKPETCDEHHRQLLYKQNEQNNPV